MHPVVFDYKGKAYTGSLILSDKETPEYYWYFFDNSDMVEELGDCVSFVRKKENLQTTRTYSEQYFELIDSIKKAIMPYVYHY